MERMDASSSVGRISSSKRFHESISSSSKAPHQPTRITSTGNREPVAKRGIKRRRLGNGTGSSRPMMTNISSSGYSNSDQLWQVERMGGDCAPFNDHSCMVQDRYNDKIYMIGGWRPNDESRYFTSDFYCYHNATDEWENLTDSIVFHDPFDPYSRTALKQEKRPLPSLGEPGCALWRLGDSSFIFIFGGYDTNEECASTRVIIISLERLEWWYQPFKSYGGVNPRICPAIVAIENRVYIFGGYRYYGGDPQPQNSYSIAEYCPPNDDSIHSYWHWEVHDVPYHSPLPNDVVVGQAISINAGKKIFLTPGRLNNTDERSLEFTKDNIFCFRTADRLFQKVELLGEFPKNIGWYSVFDFRQPRTVHISKPMSMLTPLAQTRGRPRKYPITSSVTMTSAPAPTSNSTSSLVAGVSAILVCAWVETPDPSSRMKDSDDIFLVPELYYIDLSNEQIKCLNVIKQTFDLKGDFEGVSFIDGRLQLLGSSNASRTRCSSTSSLFTVLDADGVTEPTWNACVDVPLQVFSLQPH